MVSKWYDLRIQAIKLRKRGQSIRDIEKTLNIPRSTLSGWFKNIVLSEEQILNLKKAHIHHLEKARRKAAEWHNSQKVLRIQKAEQEAQEVLSTIDSTNYRIQELALAMLYLGEGGKTKNGTVMASSDPLILKFFIHFLLNCGIEISNIKCALHLRADQNTVKLTNYWSKQLGIPTKNFTLPSKDLRTGGRPSYSTYNGVCVVSCGNIALQRRLVFLSRKFCEEVTSKGS